MLIILFARWNFLKSLLEELETVDKINFSGQIWPDSDQIWPEWDSRVYNTCESMGKKGGGEKLASLNREIFYIEDSKSPSLVKDTFWPNWHNWPNCNIFFWKFFWVKIRFISHYTKIVPIIILKISFNLAKYWIRQIRPKNWIVKFKTVYFCIQKFTKILNYCVLEL